MHLLPGVEPSNSAQGYRAAGTLCIGWYGERGKNRFSGTVWAAPFGSICLSALRLLPVDVKLSTAGSPGTGKGPYTSQLQRLRVSDATQ